MFTVHSHTRVHVMLLRQGLPELSSFCQQEFLYFSLKGTQLSSFFCSHEVLHKANSERGTTGGHHGTQHQHCPPITTVAISTS